MNPLEVVLRRIWQLLNIRTHKHSSFGGGGGSILGTEWMPGEQWGFIKLFRYGSHTNIGEEGT